MPPTRPIVDRFWEKVEKTDSCWLWTGSLTKSGGYGQIASSRKNGPIRAHRLSYEMAYGPIPTGLSVLHRCDNPPCVRPDHLFLGTRADNSADRVAKGRNGHRPHGDDHYMRRPEARRRYETAMALLESGQTIRQVASAIGLTYHAVWTMKKGRSWR